MNDDPSEKGTKYANFTTLPVADTPPLILATELDLCYDIWSYGLI